MSHHKISYELDGPVATVTMNDPATMNAAGIDMAEELADAFARAGKEARAVILTGTGRGFCSGANLASPTMGAASSGDGLKEFDAGRGLDSHYNPLVYQMRDLPIPFVTAVNGAAAGIGCSFALLGDLSIAGESAYFLQAFRRIGLVPDGGSTYMLTRAVGRARAMEMMLLGEKIPAAQALDWGLINRVVPDAELMTTAREMALNLANGPTKTLAMIRKIAWAGMDATWDEQLQAERVVQRDAGRTADFREGVAAFLMKRPAQFTGA